MRVWRNWQTHWIWAALLQRRFQRPAKSKQNVGKPEFAEVGAVLAYRRLTFSVMDKNLSNIVEYTQNDLADPEAIKEICNMYCAYMIHITKTGWKFMIEHFGYEGLYVIDKSCDYGFYYWHEDSDNSFEAYKKWITDMIEGYPKVPDYIYKADTPEGIARTALQAGKTAEEVAKLFEMPLDYVRSL